MGVSTAKRSCTGITKDGRPCGAPALDGDEFCFFHSPRTAEQRRQAHAAGGRARHNRSITGDGRPVHIRDLADVVRLLERELSNVLALERSVARARCVGYLAGIVANIYQVSELEQRVATLERARAGR